MYADTEHLGPLQRSKPLAGTMLQYNPFLDQHKYNNYDFKPKGLCCRSKHCDLFYQVRPIPSCYWRSPFAPGDKYIYMNLPLNKNIFYPSAFNRWMCFNQLQIFVHGMRIDLCNFSNLRL